MLRSEKFFPFVCLKEVIETTRSNTISPMKMNLDQLTDLIGEIALERHLGLLKVPLPSPAEIRHTMDEAYRRIWEVLTAPDEEGDDESANRDWFASV